jgi:hypothetical protein
VPSPEIAAAIDRALGANGQLAKLASPVPAARHTNIIIAPSCPLVSMNAPHARNQKNFYLKWPARNALSCRKPSI